ncbi:Elongation factor 1-alpha [Venturia nashicola]|uniref:Elongation factor 1-alpha n=1 Tax=Venturia nashicola TaxID=86259 RepID=A0A4Z1PAI4_9PEZI|nr:Elongation factor 1-alpha [Venturia nashicola]
MANQFSAHLDDLFSIDKGLDTTLRQVENKRQSVYVQQRELEELQERIREAEARLGQNSSDSSDDGDVEEAPVYRRRGTNAARLPSVFAIAETTEETPIPKPVLVQAKNTGNQTPVSTNSAEYVVVRRPRPNPRKNLRVDSHIEVSSKETTEAEDSEDDSSEADSSEEEEDSQEESSEEE